MYKHNLWLGLLSSTSCYDLVLYFFAQKVKAITVLSPSILECSETVT